MTPYTIRPITLDDVAGFRQTLATVARESLFLSFLEPAPLESCRSYVQDNIAKNHTHLVAEQQGRIVGWCDIVPSPRDFYRHSGVMGMGLEAVHCGQGLGRKLLSRALEMAEASGLSRIELTVHADNARAIRLYQSQGFVEEGRKVRGACVQGVFKDVLLMARLSAA